MKPQQFKQVNKNLTKPSNMTDEQCGSLPVHCDGIKCVSLWKLSWRERFSALFFGRLWLVVISGETQPPVAMLATRDLYTHRS